MEEQKPELKIESRLDDEPEQKPEQHPEQKAPESPIKLKKPHNPEFEIKDKRMQLFDRYNTSSEKYLSASMDPLCMTATSNKLAQCYYGFPSKNNKELLLEKVIELVESEQELSELIEELQKLKYSSNPEDKREAMRMKLKIKLMQKK